MSFLDALLLDPAPFDLWIACRTDGIRGSGTLNDPYDGSTQTLFDASMNTVPPNTRVHLGPGIFQTRGYSDDSTEGWQIKPGVHIVGSGIDVTILKLVGATNNGSQYFAIGHALTETVEQEVVPKLADLCAVLDLTIDCNLDGNLDGESASVACGAIRLMGNHVRIRNVNAIGWGAYKPTNISSPVFSVLTGYYDDTAGLVEVEDSGIESCQALLPSRKSEDAKITALHVGIRDEATTWKRILGNGPFIRNCFVDGTFKAEAEPANPAGDFYGVSMGWCRGGIVEANRIFNTMIGGPYHDSWSTKDLIVRNNYYSNVWTGPYQNIEGNSGNKVKVELYAMDYNSTGLVAPMLDLLGLGIYEDGVAEATALVTEENPSGQHGFLPGEIIRITGASDPAFNGYFKITSVAGTKSFQYAFSQAPASDSENVLANRFFQIGRLVVENNVVENNLILLDNPNPVRHHYCGKMAFFNNRTPGGNLLRGLDAEKGILADELASEVEEVVLMSFLD